MLHAFSSIRTPATTKPQAADFNGEWLNELGSKMNLTVSADGSLLGRYKTAVGSPFGNEDFPLVGFAAGDLLTFTVNFGRYSSLTSWAGQLAGENDQAVIKTMWLLARNVPDPDDSSSLWGTVLTGYNNFMRRP